jgi:hypothetical protein
LPAVSPAHAAGEAVNPTIGGDPEQHEIGTGVGAAGGAIAGATVGSVAGPIGTAAGAAIGGVAGGLAGKGAAEVVNPDPGIVVKITTSRKGPARAQARLAGAGVGAAAVRSAWRPVRLSVPSPAAWPAKARPKS